MWGSKHGSFKGMATGLLNVYMLFKYTYTYPESRYRHFENGGSFWMMRNPYHKNSEMF